MKLRVIKNQDRSSINTRNCKRYFSVNLPFNFFEMCVNCYLLSLNYINVKGLSLLLLNIYFVLAHNGQITVKIYIK